MPIFLIYDRMRVFHSLMEAGAGFMAEGGEQGPGAFDTFEPGE